MAARPAHDPLTSYQPPTPSFTTCEVCGMVCLREQGVLVTACLGVPHVCDPSPSVRPEETLPCVHA